MKLKKILFSSLSCVIAISPVAAIIACNKDEVKVSDTEAYKGKTLNKDFKIPEGTKVIGKSAFDYAILPDNFKIPEGVTTIKSDAFNGVTFPKGFQLPKSITTIEEGAFSRATFQTTFEWPKSIKKLPNYVFLKAKFTRAEDPQTFPDEKGIYIPKGITSFGKRSFAHVKFPSGFTVPTTLKFVGTEAFTGSDFSNLGLGFDFPKDMHYGPIRDGGGLGPFQDSKWEIPKIDPNTGHKIGVKYKRFKHGREEYAKDAFLSGNPTFDGTQPNYPGGDDEGDQYFIKKAEYEWLFEGITTKNHD